ncbi:MAG: LysM peptidoglycan-binding domain-containing protein [Bacteroidales bacterium]
MVETKKQISVVLTIALMVFLPLHGFSNGDGDISVVTDNHHGNAGAEHEKSGLEEKAQDVENPTGEEVNAEEEVGLDDEGIDNTDKNDTISLLDIDEKYQAWLGVEDSTFDDNGAELVTAPLDGSDAAYIDRLSKLNSAIPLTYNKEVRKYIDLYTGSWHRTTSTNIALSTFYFDKIDAVFDRYDIPLEIKYLAVVESGLNPIARSHMGAKGMWQFMFYTAKKYGLQVTSMVDDRYDFMKQTDAAARFLLDLYSMYDDWQLAMAAYNCGPGNVNKAIARSGGKKDFWDIYAYLPKETRTYLPKYIAIMYAMNYAKDYGIEPNADMFRMTHSVEVEAQDYLYLSQLADKFGVDEEYLKKLNPQYFRGIVPASKDNPCSVFVPVELATKFYIQENTLYAMADDKNAVEKVNKNTPPAHIVDDTYSVALANSAKLQYTVKNGDNVGYIAEWYGVSSDKIRRWNNLRKNLIRAGQKLTIYVPKDKKSYYTAVNTLSFEQKQQRIGATSKQHSVKLAGGGSYQYHTVKSGDNFWNIADKYGVSTNDLIKLNEGVNSQSLKIGDQIKVRKKS